MNVAQNRQARSQDAAPDPYAPKSSAPSANRLTR